MEKLISKLSIHSKLRCMQRIIIIIIFNFTIPLKAIYFVIEQFNFGQTTHTKSFSARCDSLMSAS